MPGFVCSPATPHAMHELRAAVQWAREHRVPLRLTDSFGVVCTGGHLGLATWEPDEYASGVSPVGAAILKSQPQTTDPDEAATIALGAPLPFIEGVAFGLAKLQPTKAWTESIARVQFLAGLELGTFARAWVMRAEVGPMPLPGQAPS